MLRALHIPTDADEPITELEVHALEDYQAAVGGWIEPVDIADLGVTVYVHEEGLVLGLPFNSRATFPALEPTSERSHQPAFAR